jgi:hypothetical protein
LPPGVTATFDPISLFNGQSTATLTLTAALDAPTGTGAVTVNSGAQGIAGKSSIIPVTVSIGTTPAVLVSASSSFLELLRGTSGQVTVNLARFAGYSDEVSISVDGLPANVTATAAPIAAGQSTTTLMFNVGNNAEFAQTPLTLRATGSGIQPATAPFSLVVVEPPGFRFNFTTLGSNSPPVPTLGFAILPGGTYSRSVLINRISGFSEAITVTLVGFPAGITSNLPQQISASAAAVQAGLFVTIEVGPQVPLGTYVGKMRGVATGGLTYEADVQITVVPP